MIIQITKNAESVDPVQHLLLGLFEVGYWKYLFIQANPFIYN